MGHYNAEHSATFHGSWNLSDAVTARGLVFITGVTGAVGVPVDDVPAREQFVAAFEQLASSLQAAGASFSDLVELTTYHVQLRAHIDLFQEVKNVHIQPPYPAWTAIGVQELITPGTLVEIRAIALDQRQPG